MKIVYIAHPISGDVQGNLDKIKGIIREINLTRQDIVPFAPYFIDCHCLNDFDAMERRRGIKNNTAYFTKGVIDEVWLYGHKISEGMEHEIALAESLDIPVIDKTYEEYEGVGYSNED